MTQEELQQKYDLLFERVVKMREAQINYFRYRTQSDLNTSKNLEREMDHYLKVEAAKKKSNQKELF